MARFVLGTRLTALRPLAGSMPPGLCARLRPAPKGKGPRISPVCCAKSVIRWPGAVRGFAPRPSARARESVLFAAQNRRFARTGEALGSAKSAELLLLCKARYFGLRPGLTRWSESWRGSLEL
ncbi:hypothetical protein C2I18_15325 [Paenibacillus sp. PK3_47]|nr:hypothetical protein C2I18_15325 [Paenibacillus sp. PK3_47]